MSSLLTTFPVRFLHYLWRQFFSNQGILNAAALTYTTLFAVVPLMTVSYAMLATVPSFQGVGEQVQDWVFSNFVPATGAVVQDYLASFASQARKLTAVGVVLLAVTSLMMIKNIEAAMNRIWRVAEPRRGLSSFLLYWAILTLGPVLIGLGLVLTSYLASLPLISSATDVVEQARLLGLLPMVMSTAAFTLLYAAVPNCKVPLKHALIGALVVAVLFESAKRAFALFVTQFPSYELIYGAFAAVPLFLMWVFISWVIILLGAELSRALSVYNPNAAMHQQPHLQIVMAVLYRLWLAQEKGEIISDRQLLQEVPGLDQEGWDKYVVLLKDQGLVSQDNRGDYLLCRDLGRTSLYQLINMLPWPLPAASQTVALSIWQRKLDQLLLQSDEQQQLLFEVSVEHLFGSEGSVPVKEERQREGDHG